jgi:hypothetical protein
MGPPAGGVKAVILGKACDPLVVREKARALKTQEITHELMQYGFLLTLTLEVQEALRVQRWFLRYRRRSSKDGSPPGQTILSTKF